MSRIRDSHGTSTSCGLQATVTDLAIAGLLKVWSHVLAPASLVGLQELAATLAAGDPANPATKSAIETLGLSGLDDDYAPPSKVTQAAQRLADQGRKGFPYWPSETVDGMFAPHWCSVSRKDGSNSFGSVYAFLSCWLRWGLMSVCLQREADGSHFWSVGNMLTYLHLLLKVGHVATQDSSLSQRNVHIVSFVVNYDHSLRQYFHHLCQTQSNFDIADHLKDLSTKIYEKTKREMLAVKSGSFSKPGWNPRGSPPFSKAPPQDPSSRKTAPQFPASGTSNKPRPPPGSVQKPCKYLLNGQTCPFGDDCMFQHSGVKREFSGDGGGDPKRRR